MGVRNVGEHPPPSVQLRVKAWSGKSNSDDATDRVFVSDFRKTVSRNKRSQVTLSKCGPCSLSQETNNNLIMKKVQTQQKKKQQKKLLASKTYMNGSTGICRLFLQTQIPSQAIKIIIFSIISVDTSKGFGTALARKRKNITESERFQQTFSC